ncbi:MAG: hypothetical protein WCH10_06125 [bacterium]
MLKASGHIKEVYSVEKILEGLSGSKIFKVSSSDKTYIIKFVKPKQYSFEEELISSQIISDSSLGPKIYFYDNEKK